MKQLNVLVIGDPFARSGGGSRCLEVVSRYKEHGISPILVIPPFNNEAFRMARFLPALVANGVKIIGAELAHFYAQKKKAYARTSLLGYAASSLLVSRFSNEIARILRNVKIDFVMGQHELWDVIQATHQIAEKLGVSSAIVLQAPPFYQNSYKLFELDMLDSLSISQLSGKYPLFGHYAFLSPPLSRRVASILYAEMIEFAGETTRSAYYKSTSGRHLDSIDRVLAVSKSIPFEMGDGWIEKVTVLEPSVAVDQEWGENDCVETEKGDYVLYFTRLVPSKGVLEVPFIWKAFLKNSDRKLKLYVVGAFEDKRVEEAFEFLISKLGLENNVKCLGYYKGKQLIDIVAKARAVIYPSHSDSVSLVVLECLALGTPIIAYDIPAIRFNYYATEGVEIVPEFDVVAMGHGLSRLIEDRGALGRLRLPTWDKVAEGEANLIRAGLLY